MDQAVEIDVAINGESWDASVGGVANCGGLLRIVEDEVARRGECVATVRVNGRDVSREDLGDLDDREVTAGDRWEVTTSTLSDVLKDALPNACAFTADLSAALNAAARNLRWGDAAASADQWSRCIDGLIVLNQLMAIVEGVRPSTARALGGERDRMASALGQISQAQQKEDWVYVADLIEAKIQPTLQATREVFTSLKAA
ncbi:MAG: hypothetical protein KC466_13020 [Myxococcales bacterium]|nr:hypothetical protein [Myxococcales bacterium]